MPKKVGEQNHLQASEISYACDIREAEWFGELFWATGWRRRADLYEEVVFICDGAAWIWRLVEKYFPKAIQIVDWYHASEYLSPVADAAFGQGSFRPRNGWSKPEPIYGRDELKN